MNRYARQVALPAFGRAGQAALEASHALVIGAGGLGAPVLLYLAGAGVGRITIVDPDRVEPSNLHRQTLFGEGDIGVPKAVAAARAVAERNGAVSCIPRAERFDPDNAAAMIEAADVVVDCADSFAASYLASDLCGAAGRPLVSASALELGGYCGGFCGGAPSLRAVFPELPGQAASCATGGVMGPVVGIAGAIQAQMALAILAGIEPSPLGQLVTFDAASWRFAGFRFDGAPEPERAPRFISLAQIAPEDALFDLRAPKEGPIFHPAAIHVPPGQLGAGGVVPRPGQRAVLACRSGLRAFAGAERLGAVWDGDIVLLAIGALNPGETQ
ncbi:Molybdopterin biosynthesis protein MoeB [Profundibacterium mesophilum KAUST100406-0324]|uniref:Molybdopterin biosynthesis protein MoeB n=2 Tax=Profundibacterium TaxID=1258570 RepID=A0A921NX55_9RHOB|nr:Molybdopterin biosynthesis protein MoeB [Profundibacterium mesophilum KAUST100406-0324]